MEKIYEIIAKPISKWLIENGYIVSEDMVLTVLILLGLVLFFTGKKLIQHIDSTHKKKFNKNLYPYFNDIEIDNSRENYITQKFQNVAPSKEDELAYANSSVAKQKIIKFFLKLFEERNDKKFFIILADSGMGKTTFSLNLYRKYNSSLRYFLKKNKYDIKLIPLGFDNSDEKIEKLKEDSLHLKTILILDALDEDSKAIENSHLRVEKLIDLTREFRFVIVTCRTQFFNNEDLEPKATNIPRLGMRKGYYYFEKLYLSPFSNRDIDKFINKKYGFFSFFNFNKAKAKEIVKNSPYLMARPMLLDFIDDIVKHKNNFEYTYNIYSELINSWLERERKNVADNKNFTFKDDLLKFSKEIALKIYDKRKQLGYTISQIEFENIAKTNNLDLSNFEMKTRSLLNRNPEGSYKFSHKSILEFFLAKEIYRDIGFKRNFDEEGMDMAISFYDELCYMNDYQKFVKDGKILEKVILHTEYEIVPKILSQDDILKITKLELIDFQEDTLRALRCFKNINELQIRNSKIETLEDINSFEHLTNLIIENSSIKDLKRISLLKSLTSLKLNNLDLRDYQKNEIVWKDLTQLVFLDLSFNKLTSISELEVIPTLKKLSISNNEIQSLKFNKHLIELNLSNNNISNNVTIPENVESLDVSNNHIMNAELPEGNKLKNLNLSHNSINSFSAKQNKIQVLKLSGCRLENSINNEISFCKNLFKLNMSHNLIDDIEIIRDLDKLKELDISLTLVKELKVEMIPDSLNTIHIPENIELDSKIMMQFYLEEEGKVLMRKK